MKYTFSDFLDDTAILSGIGLASGAVAALITLSVARRGPAGPPGPPGPQGMNGLPVKPGLGACCIHCAFRAIV